MAWYNGGVWTDIRVQELPYIMSDLAKAINERRVCLDLDLVEFKTGADGSGTSYYPTPSDFDGQRIGSAIGASPLRDNIVLIKSGISGLWASKSYTYTNSLSQTMDTIYYIKWATSAINKSHLTNTVGGYDLNNMRVDDATFFCKARKLLDLMKYPVLYFHTESTSKYRYGEATGGDFHEDSFDEAKAASLETFSPSHSHTVYWNIQSYGPSTGITNLQSECMITLNTEVFTGTLIDTVIAVGTYHTYTDDPIEVEFEGASFNTVRNDSSALSGDYTYASDTISGWPTIGTRSEGTFEITTTPPTDSPYAHDYFGTTLHTGTHKAELMDGNYDVSDPYKSRIYFSIASEVTN